ANFLFSAATAISGTEQVGLGVSLDDDTQHALLWSGSAASAVDLSPTNLTDIPESGAFATNGNLQVGYGIGAGTGNQNNALLWSGAGNRAVTLQDLLPAGTWTDSEAFAIDAYSHVFGIADGTYNGITGTYAVEWSVSVPEPLSLCLLAPGMFAL